MTSLVLFTLGSALCAVADSTTALVLFRVLQGVGGGMIMPLAQLIMAQVAGPKRMGRVMGDRRDAGDARADPRPGRRRAILESLHWSWIFLVNVPIGVARLLRSAGGCCPHTDSGEAGRLDVLGLALLLDRRRRAIVYGLAQLGTPTRAFDRASGGLADRRRLRAVVRLLLARAAHRAPAARHPPVREPHLRGRVVHDLRRSAPRCSGR